MKNVFSLLVICLVTVSAMAQSEYVDLGLPSGTLWKTKNEPSLYTYDKSVTKFSGNLPEKHHFEELQNKCQWIRVDDGYKVVGPNGNYIILPASGDMICIQVGNEFLGAGVADCGGYWSSTPYDSNKAWRFVISPTQIKMEENGHCAALSVRLVQLPVIAQSKYVDLGLPSGTLWKQQNESGFYTYEEALNRFGNKLPKKYHFVELQKECTWIWMDDYGYKVVGPNGNSITLPAAGSRLCYGDVNDVGTLGYYWSSTPGDSDYVWGLFFSSGGVTMVNYARCSGPSVRLVQ